jgi:hypothetical protein
VSKYENQLGFYERLNKNAKKGGAVFFGCDRLYSIPVSEITQDMNLDINTYNRSLKGLVIADAATVAEECFYSLNPSKLFVDIGENDISNENFKLESFIESYEWFLYNVHNRCKCSICIIALAGNGADTINERLYELAIRYGCEFLEINDGDLSVNFIRKTKYFLRRGVMEFYDAMTLS